MLPVGAGAVDGIIMRIGTIHGILGTIHGVLVGVGEDGMAGVEDTASAMAGGIIGVAGIDGVGEVGTAGEEILMFGFRSNPVIARVLEGIG